MLLSLVSAHLEVADGEVWGMDGLWTPLCPHAAAHANGPVREFGSTVKFTALPALAVLSRGGSMVSE
jgi:hypothetical protein